MIAYAYCASLNFECPCLVCNIFNYKIMEGCIVLTSIYSTYQELCTWLALCRILLCFGIDQFRQYFSALFQWHMESHFNESTWNYHAPITQNSPNHLPLYVHSISSFLLNQLVMSQADRLPFNYQMSTLDRPCDIQMNSLFWQTNGMLSSPTLTFVRHK